MPGRVARKRIAFVWVCSAAALASLVLPWIGAGLDGKLTVHRGSDFMALTVPVAVGAVVTGAGALVARLLGRSDLLWVSTVSSAVMAVGCAALIILLETAADLIPSSLVPRTLSRWTFGVSAEPGLWVAFAASVAAAMAAAGLRPPSIYMLDPLDAPLPRRIWAARVSVHRFAIVAIAAVMIAALVLRYSVWIDGSAARGNLGLAGWEIPWIRPLSLFGTLALLVGILTVASGRAIAGALVAAASGWLLSFLAALVIVTADTLAELRLDDVAPAEVRRFGLAFHPAPAAWWTFFLGISVAGAAAMIIRSTESI